MAEREVRFRIVGDASQAVSASKEAASGLDHFSQGTQEAGKQTELFNLKGKDMHKLMHSLNEIAPGLGSALRLALNPAAIGIGGTLLLVNDLKGQMEALEKTLTSSEWESGAANIGKLRDAMAGLKEEASAYGRELERIKGQQQDVAERASALSKIHDAESGALDKIREAQKKMELAQTESIQDPIQKKNAQAEIEMRYAAEKAQREDADAKFKLNEQYRQIANERNLQSNLTPQLDAARQRQQSLGTEESVNSKIQLEQGRLKTTQDEIAEKQKLLDELDAKEKKFGKLSFPQLAEQDILTGQLTGLKGTESAQQRLIAKLLQQKPGRIDAINAAGEDVHDLEARIKASATREAKLRKDLPIEERVAGIESQSRNAVQNIDIARELAGHDITVKQAIGMLRNQSGGNVGNLITALTELARMMQGMQNQSPNSGEVQALWRAVNQIQSQLLARRIWALP